MKRIACGVKYLGTHYHGWQKQSRVISVQSQVEHALSSVAQEPVSIQCAGRTDKGVHATQQVIHFDTHAVRPLRAWILGSRTHLPADIVITWANHVSDDFHARFSATSRRYRYVIFNGIIPSMMSNLCTWVPQPLDEDAMNRAAQCMLGEHDFSSFRGAHCQSRSPWRCVLSCSVTRSCDFVYVDVVANAFLQHMVRIMVGALIHIGQGKKPTGWIQELLSARDRTQAGPTAASQGLYLVDVRYPECFAISTTPQIPSYALA